ncbi:MAG: ABC transporter permease [Chloroflexi bacterium]|nr:ABC transporter permease [Chloroflexota bacterium]
MQGRGNRLAEGTVASSARPGTLRGLSEAMFRLRGAEALRRLHRHKPAVLGEIMLLIVVLSVAFGPFFAPYPLDRISADTSLAAPSWSHPFGTDNLGRDILTRVLHGGRISLTVGFLAVALGMSVGVAVGLIAGYRGGSFLDQAIMAVLDAWRGFPSLVLALALIAALGPDLKYVILAIGATSIPQFARMVRGQVLSVRENDYVLAARALGAGVSRIMWRHVFPNVLAPIIVLAVVALAGAILSEAGLSFLGLGVRPPTPSWGLMVRGGYSHLEAAPWFSLIPGAAILMTVLGAMLLGNGLRDAFDPKRRGR